MIAWIVLIVCLAAAVPVAFMVGLDWQGRKPQNPHAHLDARRFPGDEGPGSVPEVRRGSGER